MSDPVPFSRRSPLEHERDLPPVDTYAVTDDAFVGYRNGVEAWRASPASFPRIIYALAEKLKRG